MMTPDDRRLGRGRQSAEVFGTGKDFEGFSTGWYVWDPRIRSDHDDPAHVVDHHGDEDNYFYENSGLHDDGSSDIEGDFAILRDYVISNAGEPIVPDGPFAWGDQRARQAQRGVLHLLLCDFYLPDDADPSAYPSSLQDDGLRHRNGPSSDKIQSPAVHGARACHPGSVNMPLVILVDDAAVKGIASLAFWHDGAMVGATLDRPWSAQTV